jgi:glycosyltransferase involved in cell wall biosynthesis
MTTDILYLAFNRRAFTEFSFSLLLKNTPWDRIDHFVVYDDGSKDGTDLWLKKQVFAFNNEEHGTKAVFHATQFGSPVAVMNHYLDHYTADCFAKIDNDIATPPYWLQEMGRQMYLLSSLDLLGMQADLWPPKSGRYPERTTESARWIGGVGLMRRSAFHICRPSPNGRFGFTEFQQRHEDLVKAWIRPDLTTFELDRLPIEPWKSLAAEYVAQGWSRAWPPYSEDAHEYWDWAFSE